MRGLLIGCVVVVAGVVVSLAGGGQSVSGADATRIAFTRYRCETCQHAIYVVGSDGTGLRKIVAEGYNPAWSPDGKQIAYKSLLSQVFIVNADGSSKRALPGTSPKGQYGYGKPRWSPDGRRIVVIWWARGDTGLAILDVRSGHRTLVSPAALRETPPFNVDWSPDGRRLAFSSTGLDDSKARGIWVMNADGTGLRQVAQAPSEGSYMGVRWSPDGKRLLFYLDRDKDPVYTVSANGGRLKRLFTADVTSLSWSPGGRQVLYTGGPGGIKIHIFDLARRRDRTLDVAPCKRPGTCQFADWQRTHAR